MPHRISNSILDNPQRWALAVFLGALAFIAWVDLRPAIQQWGRAPQQLAELQSAVEKIPGQIVGQVTPLIDRHAERIEEKAQAEIRHGMDGALSAVAELGATADARVQSIQEQADLAINDLMTVTEKQLVGFRADLKPTLDNAAALVKDARDSWDDSYYDVKAMVESATVFTTSGARMADDARAALPKFLTLGEEMGAHFAGIAANVDGVTHDAHTLTSKFTAPKTKKQKAWSVVETVLLTGGRVALAAGVL